MKAAAHPENTSGVLRNLSSNVSNLSPKDRDTFEWFIKHLSELNLLMDAVRFTPEQRAQFQDKANDANDLLLMLLAELEKMLHGSITNK